MIPNHQIMCTQMKIVQTNVRTSLRYKLLPSKLANDLYTTANIIQNAEQTAV